MVEHIYANNLATDHNPTKNNLIVPIGYIAQAPAGGDDFVVAIRGTDSIWEWIQDASFAMVPFTYVPQSGNTEDGFTSMYGSLTTNPAGGGARAITALAIQLAGKPNATLRIAGDSLGGALASLLAIDVAANAVYTSPEVYTFASPYVGSQQFAAAYNQYVPNA